MKPIADLPADRNDYISLTEIFQLPIFLTAAPNDLDRFRAFFNNLGQPFEPRLRNIF